MTHPDHSAPRKSLSLSVVGNEPAATLPRDPVCGMSVDPARAAGSWEYKGQRYYFCNPSCLTRFQADPEHYLHHGPMGMAPAPAPPSKPAAGEKVEYFCPMDPEVISDKPGSCPKCGMALEPRTIAADEGPNPELVDMSRRFWVGLALTLPLMVVSMGQMVFAWMVIPNWVQLLLATPVVVWCGGPFFVRAAT